MKRLVEKIWDFLSKFADSDGAYDYMISVNGNTITIKSCTGIISFPVFNYLVDLKSRMSEFVDCGFYVTTCDDDVVLKFFIKQD